MVSDSTLSADKVTKPQALPAGSWRWRGLSVVCCLLAVALLLNYPFAQVYLAASAAIYSAVLWRWPSAWLLVLPVLLAAVDLSPWSGWFFVDEFDLFVLVTLAVGYWRESKDLEIRLHRGPLVLLAPLIVSYLVSLAVVLIPLPPLDANSFASYHSPYNGLRVLKGFGWAVALLPLVRCNFGRHPDAFGWFAAGMQVSLLAVSLWVILERQLFIGVFNSSDFFRVTGPFFSMHIGGQHIDAYLALAIPFLFASVPRIPRSVQRAWIGLLACLAAYTLLVTVSRGVIVAVAITVSMLLAERVSRRISAGRKAWRLAIALAVCAIALGGSAWAVSQFGRLQGRFTQWREDLDTRFDHWEQAIDRMPSTTTARLCGMGLGSFPRENTRKPGQADSRGEYEYLQRRGDTVLLLRAGQPQYFGQQVSVEPHQSYELTMDIRASDPTNGLRIVLCEKSAMYSFRYAGATIGSPGTDWKTEHATLETGKVGEPKIAILGGLKRPATLSLFPSGNEGWVELDNIRLLNEAGQDLLHNGDFSQGHDRWFFTSDDHIAWHIKSVLHHLYFEQGWLGVVAFTLLLGSVAVLLFGQWRRGDSHAIVLGMSLLGFLLVGMFGSLLDTPRITLLFYGVALIALVRAELARRATA